MKGHSIEWTLTAGSFSGKPKCHEPEHADCRVQGICDCESWEIERDPDGRAFHIAEVYQDENDDRVEVRHEMSPNSFCNVVEYLETYDSYDLIEATDHTAQIVIGTTLIDPVWDGEGYEWAPAEVSEPEPDKTLAALRMLVMRHEGEPRPALYGRNGTMEQRCRECNKPSPCPSWKLANDRLQADR